MPDDEYNWSPDTPAAGSANAGPKEAKDWDMGRPDDPQYVEEPGSGPAEPPIEPTDGKAPEGEGEDKDKKGAPPEGGEGDQKPPAEAGEEDKKGGEEKPPEAPQKIMDLLPELADIAGFKEVSVEEGKKQILDMIKDRETFAQVAQQFQEDQKQILEMSDFMNGNPEAAKAVWRVIDRIKAGLEPYPKEGEKEPELTPAQKELRARIDRLEKEKKDSEKKENEAFYQRKIDEVKSKFVDEKTKKSLFDDNDIDIIADIAIRNKTANLVSVAQSYIDRMNKWAEAAINNARANFKEEVRNDIIREYLNMKEEDRAKFFDTKKAPAAPPPVKKTLSLDDGSARKSFLNSLKEMNKASA